MSTVSQTKLRHAIRALEALPLKKQQEAIRGITALCPDGTLESAIADDSTSPDERSPLLRLIADARPFAERMVYREGIVCSLASSDNDCIDGAIQVKGEWRDKQLSEDHQEVFRIIEGNLYEAAMAAEDAGYVLGIAVGLLLRLPQPSDGVK